MKKLFLLLALLCLWSSIRAGVLVNEALVNEPGSDVTLEWIELYNDSSQSVDLTFFVLNINGTSLSLNGQGFLESGQYMIICRNLVASGASPGFETIWGNNSGLWGDTPEEAALKIAEESFSLLNATGYIELSRVSTVVSRLEWSGTGADGYSWERISRNNNIAINSIDSTGSTPGRANSVSPVALDLAIDTVIADPTDIGCDLTVEIVNLGTDSAKIQSLLLYRAIHPDTLAITDTILNFAIPPLAPGRRDTLVFSLTENSIYAYVGAMLSADGRSTNNRGFAWITGTLFPGMIISEFLPDPQSPLQTEWVELRNISGGSVNLANWRFGDELNLRLISSTTFNVAIGGRIILAQDSAAFKQFYTSFSGLLLQPSQWSSLNNAGDVIRLVDQYGFTVDRYQYMSAYGGNYTWSRDESEQPDGDWSKSAASGGTPGAANTIWTQPTAERTSVSISPQVFSPDGDGFEDETIISLTSVQASGYTLKIYDRTGREVKTFLDDQTDLLATYRWDGRTDSGERLPIGIYICYFEAEGVESVKETVVIAR